jgi:hypothetical protein
MISWPPQQIWAEMAAESGMPRSIYHAPVSFAGDRLRVGTQAVGHLMLGLSGPGRSRAQGTTCSHSSHGIKLIAFMR